MKVSLDDPEITIGELNATTTNNNRKRRKTKRGLTSSTERRKTFREKQKKEQKKMEKKQKEIEAIESLKRSRELEELKEQLQPKKIHVTLLVRGGDVISSICKKKEASTTAYNYAVIGSNLSLQTFSNPKKDGIFRKPNIDRKDFGKVIHSIRPPDLGGYYITLTLIAMYGWFNAKF
ncbi:hypothetical protein BDB01DRAFT_857239 [Pilobolus umbonatus]|nr:hypothetical protein BDB01DRAFT_857239 [Pilobolus umbonatus]